MMVMQNDDFTELYKIWILRMLMIDRAMLRFVEEDRLSDLDVARAIGMEHRTPEGADLILELKRSIHPNLYKRVAADYEHEVQKSRPKTKKFKRAEVIREIMSLIQANAATPAHGPKHYQKNCQVVAELFELNSIECDLLAFHAHTAFNGAIRDMLLTGGARNRREFLSLVAAALDYNLEELQKATSGGSRLFQMGLIKWGKGRDHHELEISDPKLAEKMLYKVCDANSLICDTVTPSPTTDLTYEDYPHMKEVLGQIRQHLRVALREKHRGVNLYLYGKPGTGKSELVRVLARELRASLYEVASEDADGKVARHHSRMDALVKANALLDNRRAMLVFDEAEDVFRSSSFFSQSLASENKGWMNRRLESNPIPTIWVSNSIRGVEAAFARRFNFIVEVTPPPRKHRVRMYRKITQGKASPMTLQKLSLSDDLTPAVVARAASVAEGLSAASRKSQYDPVLQSLVKRTLKAQQHDTAMFGHSESKIPKTYGLEYLNCEQSLESLTQGLRQHPSCRICLYGPPGTGKTTLGHWLAQELGHPLRIKKASDLLSPFLGEAEQNLAMAFEEARDQQAILMIDEVDSFLQSRERASRSWEVTQVNEMLTQIENYDGIFIASTNLMDDIDHAALRRFDIKLRFNYLSDDQAVSLLEKHTRNLGIAGSIAEARKQLTAMSHCTPGDFANVTRQHNFRNFRSAQDYAQAVVEECRIKCDKGGRTLGFGA